METTLQTLNVLPSTSEQVEAFSSDVINRVKSGEISALDLKAQLKFIERTLDKISKGVQENVLTEASKYGKKFDYKGWRIEEVEAGISYDFSNNPSHVALKEKLKQHETFLKALSEPIETVDTETGEMQKYCPPIKKSTSTLKFTAI